MIKVEDIKPKGLVDETKPKLSLIETIKPKMDKVHTETQVYFVPEQIIVGQSRGLLLSLTYAQDQGTIRPQKGGLIADNVTITEGTSTSGTIAADDVSGVKFQAIKLDVGADGVSDPYTGTTKELTNLVKGTITRLQGGTLGILTNGTVAVSNVAGGTVQVNPVSPIVVETYGTLADAAGAEFGTISAASGAGTYHYVQGFSIVCHSGTVDSYIGFGSVLIGTGVLGRGVFSEGGGGMMRNFTHPIRSDGTNSEIIYKIGGAGTVNYTVDFLF